MRTLLAVLALAGMVLSGCSSGPNDVDTPAPAGDPVTGADDVVVVAVIDSGFNPYHWDFLAGHMPQAENTDPSDDLPLDQDPATWLPGHPGADAFLTYGALRLNLTPTSGDAVPAELAAADAEAWSSVERSDPAGNIHMRWIPGTKVIGFVDFGGNAFSPSSHGVGTSSVSVGNIHGTCPDCLLVFVNGLSDEAVTWVAQQDWIDVQTNSWGYSKGAYDKIWTDCDNDAQRSGVERGQQIFFSAGNGMANAFDAPPLTLYSCQKGTDWLVTVGANNVDGASFTGHGKPADIANVGISYPSAGGGTVTADSSFSGTSNATPVTAGLYAEALYKLRRALAGASRVQENGTIAHGPGGCGIANPECALADGRLTVHELRQALYDAAQLTDEAMSATVADVPVPVTTAEMEFMNEGHGSFFGHIRNPAVEVDSIVAAANGAAPAYVPSADETLWHVAVSWCSQMVWGAWSFGEWNDQVALPAPDPQWPMRTWLATECPDTIKAVITAADAA